MSLLPRRCATGGAHSSAHRACGSTPSVIRTVLRHEPRALRAGPSVGPSSQGGGSDAGRPPPLGLNLDPQMEEQIARMLEEIDPDDLVDGEDYQYMDITEFVDAAQQRATSKARQAAGPSARGGQASTSGSSSKASSQASHSAMPGRSTGQPAATRSPGPSAGQQRAPGRPSTSQAAPSSPSGPQSRVQRPPSGPAGSQKAGSAGGDASTSDRSSGSAAAPGSRPWQGGRKPAGGADAGAGAGAATAVRPAPVDDDEPEEGLEEGTPAMTKAAFRRRAAVLVELLSAGPALEEKLATFRADIDEGLLHLALRRLKTAQELQQEPELITHLRDMCSILRVQYERITASPAMRLLDDALELLGGDPGAPEYGDRRRAAANRMRNAFSGGATQELDIFAAAAALAQERGAAADALTVEAVTIESFIAEAGSLLAEGREEHAALAEALAAFEVDTQQRAAQMQQPSALEQQQQQEREQEVAAVTQLLKQRGLALEQLADLVSIAHSFQGRGMAARAGSEWP